jgi:hypothetical protein
MNIPEKPYSTENQPYDPHDLADYAGYLLDAAGSFMDDDRVHGRHLTINDHLDIYGSAESPLDEHDTLYDLVEGLYSDQPTECSKTENFIYDIYADTKTELKPSLIIGLGYALTGVQWANTASSWRARAQKTVDNTADLSDQEKIALKSAIAGDTPAGVEQDQLGSLLRKNHLISFNASELIEALDKYDLGGLLVVSAKLIGNLKNGADSNIAVQWGDCHDILSFFAPALDISGYEVIAAELRGLAYEFLYDDHVLELDKAQHQLEVSYKHHDTVESLINSAIDQATLPEDGLQDAYYPLDTKSLGATIRKFTREYYRDGLKGNQIPDGLRTRVIVPDRTFNPKGMDSLRERIEQQIDTLCEEQEITINSYIIEDYIRKPKANSYRALQLFYVLAIAKDEVSFEVQIVGDSQHKQNTKGTSSRLSYEFQISGISTTEEDIQKLQQAEERAHHFDREGVYALTLKPSSLLELSRRLPALNNPICELHTYQDNIQ